MRSVMVGKLSDSTFDIRRLLLVRLLQLTITLTLRQPSTFRNKWAGIRNPESTMLGGFVD